MKTQWEHLVQPFFGYYLDRQGKRWLVHVGTLWMAVMLSMTGYVQNYYLLVTLAALAGLDTAVRELLAITAVIAIRSLSYTGLLAILPLYLKSKNISSIAGSHLLFIMLFIGALGELTGGFGGIPGLLMKNRPPARSKRLAAR